jgi:beta-lactamase class A
MVKVSLQTLAEGAISYSDNPATNLIIKALGGLEKMNQYALLQSL